MPLIGIMQGRLTPSNGRGVQFALKDGEWQREFELASTLGISFIQWVADYNTPLFDIKTQQEIVRISQSTGVAVRNIDLHELLTKTDITSQPDELFEKLAQAMRAIEGGALELPLLEASSLLDEAAYHARIEALKRIMTVADKLGVEVAIETDLGPEKLATLTDALPGLGIVYDSGNSAGMGYDMHAELKAYGQRLTDVHLKDKPKGGSTVPLGEGSVNFTELFVALRAIPYTGGVVIQAARGEDGKEAETIAGYIEFIKHAYEQSI